MTNSIVKKSMLTILGIVIAIVSFYFLMPTSTKMVSNALLADIDGLYTGYANGEIVSIEKVLRAIDGNGDYLVGEIVGAKTIYAMNGTTTTATEIIYSYLDIYDESPQDGMTNDKTVLSMDYSTNGEKTITMLSVTEISDTLYYVEDTNVYYMTQPATLTYSEVSVRWIENVMFTFGSYNNTNLNLYTPTISEMTVDLTLNDEYDVDIIKNREYNNFYDYTMFIDLASLSSSTGSENGESSIIDEQEGKYSFAINYSININNSIANYSQLLEFYVLGEGSYVNPVTSPTGLTYTTSPTFMNAVQVSGSEVYSYGYSTSNDYPMLTFDASKYSLEIEKNHNGTLTYYSLSYSPTFGAKLSTTSSTSYDDGVYAELGTDNIVRIILSDVGEYEFTFNVLSRFIDNGTTKIDSTQIEIDSKRLIIYGYQAYYNEDNTNNSELKHITINNDGYCEGFLLSTAMVAYTNVSTIATGIISESESASISSSYFNFPETGIEFVNPDDWWDTIVETNQAPVWLEYLGPNDFNNSNSFVYYSATGATDSFNATSYNKSLFFQETGYYIIKIEFDFTLTDFDGTDMKDSNNDIAYINDYTQIFAFYITASTPVVNPYIYTDSTTSGYDNFDILISEFYDGTSDFSNLSTIYSYEYTNKNIFIYWDDTTYFENEVTAKYYWDADFVMDRNSMDYQNQVYNKNTLFTNNGSYIIDIYYGANSSMRVTLRFYIDKTNIDNFTIQAISGNVNEFGISNYTYDGVELTYKDCFDEDFTIYWDEKASGAEISASYVYVPFLYSSQIVVSAITPTTGGELWVNNQYYLDTANNYTILTGTKSTETIVSKSYAFTSSGIYLFYLIDEAGNALIKMIVLDRTENAYIQEPLSDSTSYNIMSEDTTIIWGTHKTVKLLSTTIDYTLDSENTQILKSILSSMASTGNDDSSIVIDNGYYYLAVGNTYVTQRYYSEGNYTDSVITVGRLVNGSYEYYLDNVKTTVEVQYTEDEEGNLIATNEGTYCYEVYSQNNIVANYAFNNEYSFELSTDKAQLMVYGYDNLYDDDETESTNGRLSLSYSSATNANYLKVNWISIAGYEVESVTYTYYPISTNLENGYPYNDTATKIDVNINSEATYDDDSGRYVSQALNLSYVNTYINGKYQQTLMTTAGKYVITRTYVEGITGTDVSGANDNVRVYTAIYVDRNGIITTDAGISVELQYDETTSSSKVSYNTFSNAIKTSDFSLNGTVIENVNIYFNTNVLPAKVFVPVSKYYNENSTGTTISSLNLTAYIHYYDLSNNYITTYSSSMYGSGSSYTYNSFIDFSSNTFSADGKYLIQISDSVETFTGYGNNNVVYFAFEIENSSPSATFIGQNNQTYNTNDYTKDNELSLIITPSKSEYTASVDPNNITIERKVSSADDSTYVTYYKVIDGIIDYTSEIMAGQSEYIVSKDDGDYAPTYIDLLPYDYLSELNNVDLDESLDYIFRVTIQYEGTLEGYGNNISNFSNILYIIMDKTPPTTNIDNLISSNSGYMDQYDVEDDIYYVASVENNGIYNYSYITKNDYSFIVDNNYVMTFNNDDSLTIYYRSLTSGDNGERMLLPGDPDYYDYTNNLYEDRFMLDAQYDFKVYTTGSTLSSVIGDGNILQGYYEIVQMDKAGNTSSFVVLFNYDDSTLTGEGTYTNQDTNLVESSTWIFTNNTEYAFYNLEFSSIDDIEDYYTINISYGSTTISLRSVDYTTDEILSVINNTILTTSQTYEISYLPRNIQGNCSVTLQMIDKVDMSDLTLYYDPSLKLYYIDATTAIPENNEQLEVTSVKITVFSTTEKTYTVENNLNAIYFLDYSSVGVEENYINDAYGNWIKIELISNIGVTKTQYIFIGDSEESEESLFVDSTVSDDYAQYVIEEKNDAIYVYTSHDIYLMYLNSLYTNVEIYISIDGSTFKIYNITPEIEGSLNSYYKFSSSTFSNSSFSATGGRIEYIITFTYSWAVGTEENATKSYHIIVDNNMPEVNFVNDINENKNNLVASNSTIASNSTNNNLTIKWEDLSSFSDDNFSINILLATIQITGVIDYENAEVLTDLSSCTKKVLSSEEGSYVLVIQKIIDGLIFSEKTYAFRITDEVGSMYEIYQDGESEPFGDATDFTSISELALATDYEFNLSSIDTSYKETDSIDLYYVNNLVTYDNSDNPYIQGITVVASGDNGLSADIVAVIEHDAPTTDYQSEITTVIYQIKSNIDTSTYEKLVAITSIFVSSNLIDISNTNDFSLAYTTYNANAELQLTTIALSGYSYTQFFEDSSKDDTAPDYQNIYLRVKSSYNNGNIYDAVALGNTLYVDVYFNDVFTTTIDMSEQYINPYYMFEIEYSGFYSFVVRDKAGNTHTFGDSFTLDFYSLNLFTDLPATINGNVPVQNAIYSSEVLFSLTNMQYWTNSVKNLSLTIYRNGSLYVPESLGYNYYFSETGTYNITYVAEFLTTGDYLTSSNIVFTIVNDDEARLAIDLTNIKNYSIDSVYKGSINVTTEFEDMLNSSALVTYSSLITAGGLLGSGKYTINYSVNNRTNILDVSESFDFWINNETATISSSIGAGESTTSTITISFNRYIIYQQLGSCRIEISNTAVIYINSETAIENVVENITLSNNQDYFVQVIGVGDTLISSFKVTKNAPLNTTSLIIIVLVILLLGSGIVMFFLLRHRMKVR